MPEIESIQPSAMPSWVMMDQRFRFKDPGSFRADSETSAETQDTNGEPVRVSFDLQAPPGSSRLCLHYPEEKEPSNWDFVVASHRDAVLFRIKVDFDGLPVNRRHAMDYFVYRACSSSFAPKLTLLPRCYSTNDEIIEAVAEDAASWRGKRRMVSSSAIGLLADEEDIVVAELSIETWSAADKTAPLEAELFRLCSSSSPAAANGGGGQWELTHARSRDSNVSFQDVVRWETHSVVPFTNSCLCWADYNRGVLFCDVRQENPELRYLRLPVDDMPEEDFPTFSRTVCVTNNGETMKFVKVVENSSICPTCKHRSGFTISVWTLMVVNEDDTEWVEDVAITDNELWAMDGYDHDHLPRSVPQCPLVSMDDPHILYFVVSGKPALSPCIVTLDMKSRAVLRYDGIKDYPSDDNISNGFGFFPSSFSNYLTMLSSSK